MILFALASVAAATTHSATVEHRGARYDVAHRARIDTRHRTVGAATGARMTTQRCRWTATVRVEREIARAGGDGGVATLLPMAETVQGDRHGPCDGRGEVADARIRDAAARLVDAARGDRAATLAAIDAAHGLAAN
ncbi:hypothetical protein ASG29_07230 [Sphingomonas sp. Leaf412]|uniref:hypothetical protein n=1 Tax=Sphingomonas sp. Leaf412 TaxID=1736370 RepID=UPI0006F49203|nr:hypothetical protein [Sphingomonas sp. Leaf412]KQT31714.1 hypothetical protein ASG29_07230 [Sphingomonas sp. Leaf412]